MELQEALVHHAVQELPLPAHEKEDILGGSFLELAGL